jgi:hypothetical protein
MRVTAKDRSAIVTDMAAAGDPDAAEQRAVVRRARDAISDADDKEIFEERFSKKLRVR